MIDIRKIEEAAKHYAEENSMSIEDQMGDIYDGIEELSDAYKAGAKWMQEEFLKNLLHPTIEVPRNDNGRVLAFSKGIGYRKLYDMNDELDKTACDTYQEMWKKEVKAHRLTDWIFVDELFDLITKGGGK